MIFLADCVSTLVIKWCKPSTYSVLFNTIESAMAITGLISFNLLLKFLARTLGVWSVFKTAGTISAVFFELLTHFVGVLFIRVLLDCHWLLLYRTIFFDVRHALTCEPERFQGVHHIGDVVDVADARVFSDGLDEVELDKLD